MYLTAAAIDLLDACDCGPCGSCVPNSRSISLAEILEHQGMLTKVDDLSYRTTEHGRKKMRRALGQ